MMIYGQLGSCSWDFLRLEENVAIKMQQILTLIICFSV